MKYSMIFHQSEREKERGIKSFQDMIVIHPPFAWLVLYKDFAKSEHSSLSCKIPVVDVGWVGTYDLRKQGALCILMQVEHDWFDKR